MARTRVNRGRLAHVSDWEGLAQNAAYSPSELARLCSVSLRHLQRHFRDCYELRLGSWLSDLRLWRALLSLRDEHSVKAVAYALGYKQCSHFSREFKRFHGISPSSVQVLQHTYQDRTVLQVSVAYETKQLQLSFV